jgi:hypothetical protein
MELLYPDEFFQRKIIKDQYNQVKQLKKAITK